MNRSKTPLAALAALILPVLVAGVVLAAPEASAQGTVEDPGTVAEDVGPPLPGGKGGDDDGGYEGDPDTFEIDGFPGTIVPVDRTPADDGSEGRTTRLLALWLTAFFRFLFLIGV